MNKSIFMRLILSPFMLSMSLIVFIYKAFYITILFVRYGGEFIAYRKDDRETIFKIYEHLKNNQQ
jgi:hypothetical protein